jgi:hypothetical protein
MNKLTISEPVVVGCSRPHETRWGHFQFPSLCRLPGGALMATISDAEDATCGYGQPLRRYVSVDNGHTWQADPQASPGAGPHASCAEGFDGEYLILSASATFDLAAAGLQLPPAAGKAFAYQDFHFYKVAECPAAVRNYLTRLPAWRWTPAKPAWTPEQIAYDVDGHLCWTANAEQVVARTWFEHAPIRHGGELLYVDYRTNCLRDDGATPDGWSCLLMASHDNGRSFQKRSVLATGRVYEPMLADTADGELVCVIRGADQEQRPMLITHSADHGHTWEPARKLFTFGVFPALVRLGNGALLLAFGRPGVWVSASFDGGRTWGDPVPVIAGDARDIMAHTCGYTNLLPVSDDEALLVYSDFQHVGPDGLPCKSVEVRRIAVRR